MLLINSYFTSIIIIIIINNYDDGNQINRPLAIWIESSLIVRDTRVQSQVESY